MSSLSKSSIYAPAKKSSFPMRCTTCGRVIGHLYQKYLIEVNKRMMENSRPESMIMFANFNNTDSIKKSVVAEILDDVLGSVRRPDIGASLTENQRVHLSPCEGCRIAFLTHG